MTIFQNHNSTLNYMAKTSLGTTWLFGLDIIIVIVAATLSLRALRVVNNKA
ncbi:hypothetical protein ACG92U_10665 [Leuconostoc citreum]